MWSDATFQLWIVPYNSYLEFQCQLKPALTIIMHLVDRGGGGAIITKKR